MTDVPSCVFCGIVAGRNPSSIIARTGRAIAFMDVNPVTPGHVLVIPTSHATNLLDVDADDLAACSRLAQEVGRRAQDRLGADGINLLNCSGRAAWQTVFHFHLHVTPRYENDPTRDRIGPPWETVASTPAEIEQIGELLS